MNQQPIKLFIKTLTLMKLINIHPTVMQRLVQLMLTMRKMRLFQISNLSQTSGTHKTMDLKVKWYQNKNVRSTNLVPQHLNTPLQAFELVLKRDFIELILVVVNTNAKSERFYRRFPQSFQIMGFQGL